MAEEVPIIVKNKLITDKRDINVYHHSTRSAHIISHRSSITLPLQSVGEDDYLHISVGRSPGNLWKDCMIRLPSWLDFELSSDGNVSVSRSGNGKRTLIKIPPGPPTWEIKITRSDGTGAGDSLREDDIAIEYL